MRITHVMEIDFGKEEAAEMPEEIKWLEQNTEALERVEYETGIRFYVWESIFDAWAEKFDICTIIKGEPIRSR